MILELKMKKADSFDFLKKRNCQNIYQKINLSYAVALIMKQPKAKYRFNLDSLIVSRINLKCFLVQKVKKLTLYFKSFQIVISNL
jgi:hypothetical protein